MLILLQLSHSFIEQLEEYMIFSHTISSLSSILIDDSPSSPSSELNDTVHLKIPKTSKTEPTPVVTYKQQILKYLCLTTENIVQHTSTLQHSRALFNYCISHTPSSSSFCSGGASPQALYRIEAHTNNNATSTHAIINTNADTDTDNRSDKSIYGMSLMTPLLVGASTR